MNALLNRTAKTAVRYVETLDCIGSPATMGTAGRRFSQ